MAYLIHLGATTQHAAWSFEKKNRFESNINDISQ